MAESLLVPLMLIVMFLATWLSFVPVVPASALTWTLAIVFGAMTSFERVTPAAALVATALMLVGATSGLWLPFFGLKGKGMSCFGLIGFFIGSTIGTFVLPVPILGTMLGGIAGVVGVEFLSAGDAEKAVRSGGVALKLMLIGFVVEFIFSIAIFVTVVVSVMTTT